MVFGPFFSQKKKAQTPVSALGASGAKGGDDGKVAPDFKTILLRQGNVDTVRHAETELARRSAREFSPEYLWECCLVTTLEPCAMCSGTIYWANIGSVLYGTPESDLKALTGSDTRNPTMDLPCRDVFAAGQKKVSVWGPLPAMKDALLAPHKRFWSQT